MFDSREYEYSDITLMLGGRDVTGVRSVKITEKIEREALKAKGKFTHSIQTGNVDYELEIGVLQSEFEALLDAGGGTLAGLKGLSGQCVFGNPSLGDPVRTKLIDQIYFTEGTQEMKQGDKFMDVKLPALCTRVRTV